MIKVYRLLSDCKRSTLKLKYNVPYRVIDEHLYPFSKTKIPDNVIFRVARGTRKYDLIHVHESEVNKFLSQKFIEALSQFVDMSDKCYPIKIDGIDEQYYALYNLPECTNLNREKWIFDKEPGFFYAGEITSPLCCVSGTYSKIVTEDLKNHLVKNKITNIRFEECFLCTEEEYKEWQIQNPDWKPDSIIP